MLIETTKGLIPEEELEKREGNYENENEFCRWVEYWKDGELVHRSAWTDLKRGIESLITGSF
ncbi:MAG: hypothetical protein KGL39_16775 [Patescibacteria group bacterium]|nr:hypothetical protein [Patescibacteria group bacterium]